MQTELEIAREHVLETTSDARPCVLVVDDEEAVATVLARGLAHAGYQVATAHSGQEALQRLSEQRFDVLLSDIHMPKMRGDELQRHARQKDPDLAVLLITAAQDITTAVECLKEGVFDYMLKPVSLADLSTHVGKALERRTLTLENRDYRLHLERRVAEQAERLRKMLQNSMEALIQALEAKDEHTRDHSARVAELAAALASHLCPDRTAFRTRLHVAALFHDIGKIGVPEAVLNKPGKLDESEMAQIRRHPEIGEAILRPMLGGDTEMMAVVRSHHEQWNGEGYPDGLTGEATPFAARIVAVADAFDAMTSTRPYRPGMPRDRALQILHEGAGTQWDSQVVEAILWLEKEGRLDRLTSPVAEATLPVGKGSVAPPHPVAASPARVSPAASASRQQRPVVSASGDLDEEGIERLRTKVGALVGQGENDFILDLRRVGYLGAEAVQMIEILHLRLLESGGRMAIRDAPDHALEAFRGAGLESLFFFEQSPITLSRRPSRYGRETNRRLNTLSGEVKDFEEAA